MLESPPTRPVPCVLAGCTIATAACFGTLGDDKMLRPRVGVHIATAGPLKNVAFAELKVSALSTSHSGLRLPAEYARCWPFACCVSGQWPVFASGVLLPFASH